MGQDRPKGRKGKKKSGMKEADYELKKIADEVVQPPRAQLSCTFPQVFRFHCSADLSQSYFTRAEFLNMLGLCNGSSGGLGAYRLIQAVQVTKLALYSPPMIYNSGTSYSPEITWLGTSSVHRIFGESNVGSAQSSHIVTRPERGIEAFFPCLSGVGESEALVGISCVKNSILDVYCQVTIASDLTNVAPTITMMAAGTTGEVYYLPLDNGTGNWVPGPELNRIV